jgi:hypothetical protein
VPVGQVVDDKYSARDDLIVRWRRDFLAFRHRVWFAPARDVALAGGYMWGGAERDGDATNQTRP